MIRPIRPAIDPNAHKAAIDALQAQRAAYQRYARAMEAQARQPLGNGNGGDVAVLTADEAARGFAELEEGAGRLRPALDAVAEGGSPDQVAEVQRQMEQLMRDARAAEAAIQNMTTQLEAWRDAYGRQLAELGLTPGGAGGETVGVGDAARAASPIDAGRARTAGYGPRSRAGERAGVPAMLDRKG